MTKLPYLSRAVPVKTELKKEKPDSDSRDEKKKKKTIKSGLSSTVNLGA
jgi:hypothetical protein